MLKPRHIALCAVALLSWGCDGSGMEGEPGSEVQVFSASGSPLGPPSTAYVAPEPAAFTPYNFSWIIDGQLSGMGYPGVGLRLDKTMSYLETAGVDLVVSLTVTGVDPDVVESHGMECLHLPVKDFTAPTQKQMRLFAETVQAEMEAGRQVTVHCAGGKGRTGTMLAAWFIWDGMTSDEAIAHVRSMRPGSIETQGQLDALAEFGTLTAKPVE